MTIYFRSNGVLKEYDTAFLAHHKEFYELFNTDEGFSYSHNQKVAAKVPIEEQVNKLFNKAEDEEEFCVLHCQKGPLKIYKIFHPNVFILPVVECKDGLFGMVQERKFDLRGKIHSLIEIDAKEEDPLSMASRYLSKSPHIKFKADEGQTLKNDVKVLTGKMGVKNIPSYSATLIRCPEVVCTEPNITCSPFILHIKMKELTQREALINLKLRPGIATCGLGSGKNLRPSQVIKGCSLIHPHSYDILNTIFSTFPFERKNESGNCGRLTVCALTICTIAFSLLR